MARLAPDRPFPPYSYVPGYFPHPVSDPAGHSYLMQPETVEVFDPAKWRACRAYLWGVDLFNHGYYWEAHEAWEAVWHAAGRTGATADFLKALIKLAAAAVKLREGNPTGARRHAQRACELLAPKAGSARRLGLERAALLDLSQHLAGPLADACTAPAPSAHWPLELVLVP